ncbi:hypothetical protein [Rhodococcus erythropolis]|uniref:hypothetical protein n=1 Tax=Rhodococcus erythropolis TaxID=1833 RepID=UPI0021C14791|nr:hypothetical protein [Rhodococcus erythropolis]
MTAAADVRRTNKAHIEGDTTDDRHPADASAHQHGTGSLTPAAEPATGFDADNLTAADELAIDIGRVAIEASEGVPYGSEPDEFFLAAGKAVFYWLRLNGHRRITTEEAEEIRQVSNCALQYGNIASREAAHRLLAGSWQPNPPRRVPISVRQPPTMSAVQMVPPLPNLRKRRRMRRR